MDEQPFEDLCGLWHSKITKAFEHKKKVFQDTADECMGFYDGPHDFMYKADSAKTGQGMYVAEGMPKTTFKMTFNKVAEFVQLYVPYLYNRNPTRQVNVRRPEFPLEAAMSLMPPEYQPTVDPLSGMQIPSLFLQALMHEEQAAADQGKVVASLLEHYLNYLPQENGLCQESRMALTEALIKGRGVVWTEMDYREGIQTLTPKTSYDTVDNLACDPDAEVFKNAAFIVRRCTDHVWKLEEDWGLEPGELKASHESLAQQSRVDTMPGGDLARKGGRTADTVTYYKVWSKMGLGMHLSGAEENPNLEALEETLGKYTFLVLCEGTPYPLNLPPRLWQVPPELEMLPPEESQPVMEQAQQALLAAASWALPFYEDNGEWPCTELDFREIPRSAWPQAPAKPALGELRAINWFMSFLAGKIRLTCRDFIAVADELSDEVKETIRSGEDLTFIPLKDALDRDVTKLVAFIQHPAVNADIWRIIEALIGMVDKRLGTMDLMYGATNVQLRSAEEASMKREMTNIRPDDMAERTEQWASRVARKEAIATRCYIGPADAAPVLGEEYEPEPMPDPTGIPVMPKVGLRTRLWEQYVYLPLDHGNPESIRKVVREYEYRIEEGSVRKPNKDKDLANMDQALQVFFPLFSQVYLGTGNPAPLNAIISQWCRVRDMEAGQFQLSPFMPQPTLPPEGNGSSGGENQQAA